ncbi:hypothetical protein M5K25_009320 [Dendrobium thyrsiflorum]|uniref:DUF8040 domain-containing protein n=1 Tax=Dendrobium thyrsiflorum TaxID=117978 RepID=A0ABD0V557_DENTH
MPNYVQCELINEFNFMLREHIRVGNELSEYLASIIDEDSSNEDVPRMKRPMYNKAYTGQQYVVDILLLAEAFRQLKDLLVSCGLLRDTQCIGVDEQLATFLQGVAHGHSYRQLCEFYQHSLETVSHYFNLVLPFAYFDCHPFVRFNAQFYPFFLNALGAIDSTYIPTIMGKELQNRYRNRKSFTSQNVMTVVSFDRQFVYTASGWEGSAADMWVLRWAVDKDDFIVPQILLTRQRATRNSGRRAAGDSGRRGRQLDATRAGNSSRRGRRLDVTWGSDSMRRGQATRADAAGNASTQASDLGSRAGDVDRPPIPGHLQVSGSTQT